MLYMLVARVLDFGAFIESGCLVKQYQNARLVVLSTTMAVHVFVFLQIRRPSTPGSVLCPIISSFSREGYSSSPQIFIPYPCQAF